MMTFAFLIKISALETARPYFILSHRSLFISVDPIDSSTEGVYRRECIGLWVGWVDKLFFFFFLKKRHRTL